MRGIVWSDTKYREESSSSIFSLIVVNPSSVSISPLLMSTTGLPLFESSTNGFAAPLAPVNLRDCPCLPSI